MKRSSQSLITSKLAERLKAKGITLPSKKQKEEVKVEIEEPAAPKIDKKDCIVDEFGEMLPAGWEKYFSEPHDTWYYWDLLTDRVSWLPPSHEFFEPCLTRKESNATPTGVVLKKSQIDKTDLSTPAIPGTQEINMPPMGAPKNLPTGPPKKLPTGPPKNPTKLPTGPPAIGNIRKVKEESIKPKEEAPAPPPPPQTETQSSSRSLNYAKAKSQMAGPTGYIKNIQKKQQETTAFIKNRVRKDNYDPIERTLNTLLNSSFCRFLHKLKIQKNCLNEK